MEIFIIFVVGCALSIVIASVVILGKHKTAGQLDFFHDRLDVFLGVFGSVIFCWLWPVVLMVFLVIGLANWIVKKFAIKNEDA